MLEYYWSRLKILLLVPLRSKISSRIESNFVASREKSLNGLIWWKLKLVKISHKMILPKLQQQTSSYWKETADGWKLE